MAYSTGMLKHRIKVQNRTTATADRFGIDGSGIEYEDTCRLWASIDFVKGMRALREGAIDVYGVIMVRTRYTNAINVRSRIVYEGETYNVLGDTLHIDRQANIVQFNAQLIVE